MRGRPTKYKKEYVELCAKYASAGLTEAQMAQLIGVDITTLWHWKKKHKEFFNAVKVSKDLSDENVVRSLYERATGYKCQESKFFADKGTVDVVKHYPPDPTSAIFWLKNRQPEEWREKQEVDHTFTEFRVQLPDTDESNN